MWDTHQKDMIRITPHIIRIKHRSPGPDQRRLISESAERKKEIKKETHKERKTDRQKERKPNPSTTPHPAPIPLIVKD